METVALLSRIATDVQLAGAVTTAWHDTSALLVQVGLASGLAITVVLQSPIHLENT